MTRKEFTDIVNEILGNNSLDPDDHVDLVTDILDALEMRTDAIDEEDEIDPDDSEE